MSQPYYSVKDGGQRNKEPNIAKKEAEKSFNNLKSIYLDLSGKLNKLNGYFLISIRCLQTLKEAEEDINSSMYYMQKVKNTASDFKIGPNYVYLVLRMCGTLQERRVNFNGTVEDIRNTQKMLSRDMYQIGARLDSIYDAMVEYNNTWHFGLPTRVNTENIPKV